MYIALTTAASDLIKNHFKPGMRHADVEDEHAECDTQETGELVPGDDENGWDADGREVTP